MKGTISVLNISIPQVNMTSNLTSSNVTKSNNISSILPGFIESFLNLQPSSSSVNKQINNFVPFLNLVKGG